MPASDYGSHDPDFTQEQIDQCARIVDAIRAINTKVVRLSGSAEELAAAADQVEGLARSLDHVTQHRAIETFRFEFDFSAPNNVMPFNPATGELNPVAPKLEMKWEDNELVADLVFSSNYESGPDAVQGGMVAAFYDQLLAYVVMANGKVGFTAWLKVDYLKPTPIDQPLRFKGWVESVDGKKFTARGSCYQGDAKLSEAEGLILGGYDLPRVDRPVK